MQPKLGHEVGDIILNSIFISLTVILISRLSLSYPLEKLEKKQYQPGKAFSKLDQNPYSGEITDNLENDEGENSSLTKRMTEKAHQYKCEFVGNVGLKNHCIRFLVCSKVGYVGIPRHCASRKHFDLKKRLCVDKKDAECDSSKICPDDITVYRVENGYLQCRNGVPYPKTSPTCPLNMAFEQRLNKCVAKQEANVQTGQFGNNGQNNAGTQQVLQVNAVQMENGKDIQVQINKGVVDGAGTQVAGRMEPGPNSGRYHQQMSGGPLPNQNAGTYSYQYTSPMINQDVGPYPIQNSGPLPNQTQILQVNAYQDEKGKGMKIQVNKTEVQDPGTQNLNAAGPQQQMSAFPNQNIGTFPYQDRGTFQSQNVGTFQNPNAGTFQNQNAGTFQNQNEGTIQNQEGGAFQDQDGHGFQNQNEGTFQNQNGGPYQNQNGGPYQNQNSGPYQNQNVGPYQNLGINPNQNIQPF